MLLSYQVPNSDNKLPQSQPKEDTKVPHTQSGGTPTLPPLDVLIEAAKTTHLPPDIRQRDPRYGKLGACVACKQHVSAHIDTAGGFIGCPAVGPDTVFVLVPVNTASEPESDTAIRRRKEREFRVARYKPTLKAAAATPDDLSDHRKRVLEAVIEAGERGTLAKEVAERSGLMRGSVGQALDWLRAHNLIDAKEDDNG